MDIRSRISWILSLYAFLLFGIIGCASVPEQFSKGAPRISKETLNTWLDDSSLILIDVRRPQDWKKSGEKIKSAIQENPNKFASWVLRYPKTETIVLY